MKKKENKWQVLLTIFLLGDFCCLLKTLASSLELDEDRQNVSPDLDPSCLTL